MLAWQPSANIDALRRRAAIIQDIRQFFLNRHYLEVETPLLAQFGGTDIYLNNIEARFRGKTYYLQTSPEYHMKRLLAAGSGSIFQFTRAFRDDEWGRLHNPEFSMLEYYQLDVDHHQLLQEMDVLLQHVLQSPPLVKKTYQALFEEVCSLNPHEASIAEFKACLTRFELGNVLPDAETDRDQYLFLLMSHVVEPFYADREAPLAVYDYPTSQAALAQVKEGFAERFEVYFKGIELANGFHELSDARLQAERFDADNQARLAKGLPSAAVDPFLLAALSHGLPPCSGVALGLDRLIMLALDKNNIQEIMAFDFSRA